ncbi:adenylate/guanylate cyclase domain-containing protein [Bradyrhizobium sp. 2TAF24]|uniref:adenylate/guanylate cyclase domain-containing protein n=1 Tax=Bradyrhizobium sp. 2TAF24 TaxID=3233011 RepID=UPI003F92A08E
MPLTPSLLRANLRLASGLTLLTFVICHFMAHACLLISIPFGEAALTALMAPWKTLAGTAVLATAAAVHYLNALWSIYRRRSLRMSQWELWQLVLGLSIPLLVALHVVDTRIGELAFDTTPYYVSALVSWWVRQPLFAVLQFTAILVVWTHACIGVHFWLRLKPWFPTALPLLRPVALLLPTLALAGFVTTGNQVRREADRNPEFTQIAEADSNISEASRHALADIAFAVMAGHILLTLLPFATRGMRGALYRRRRPPTVTHASGRRCVVQPGASVLETLRDNGIPHAAVCGGRARCTTCRVLVTRGLEHLPPPDALEAKALMRIHASPETRLACQIHPVADITVLPLLSADASAADGAARGGLEGSERLITVIFVDLRGSTSISETRMPYDVLFLLNRFFREMTSALEVTGGHYSQFTGDGLMALYGLDGDSTRGAADALRGAREMLLRLDRLNHEMSAELPQPLRIGIGIHFNEAIVGAMGPPNSQIISAIGDTVNTCARLESLTKDYNCPLIVSRQAADAAGLDMNLETLHEAAVKGRAAKVQFYALQRVPEPA